MADAPLELSRRVPERVGFVAIILAKEDETILPKLWKGHYLAICRFREAPETLDFQVE